jgi:hypothetical protein
MKPESLAQAPERRKMSLIKCLYYRQNGQTEFLTLMYPPHQAQFQF